MIFAAETATPTLDFIATNDVAPTEQPEDVLHGQPLPMDAYDDRRLIATSLDVEMTSTTQIRQFYIVGLLTLYRRRNAMSLRH